MTVSALLLAALVTLTPDYSGITVPPEIAPLNFDLDRTAKVVLTSRAGRRLEAEGRKIRFDRREWREFLSAAKGTDYEIRVLTTDGTVLLTATNGVSADPIDRYLTYRLIPPSYGTYNQMGIYERDLFTSDERALFETRQLSRNQCVNCHTTNRGDPETFLFQFRNNGPSTVIASRRSNLYRQRIDHPKGTFGSSTYPAWHPSGDFIAFSFNEPRQSFFLANPAKVEVADLRSDLGLYLMRSRRTLSIENDPQTFESFPTWSADGKTLYSVQAKVALPKESDDGTNGVTAACNSFLQLDLPKLRYSLVARDFNQERLAFSPPRTVLDGNRLGRSVLFPRITPDGRHAIVTLAEYGAFPIWHRESDLAVVDLATRSVRVATEINSSEAESYHAISSSGRWIVFSSRRGDGTYTRPYFAHFDPASARFSKPFLLPAEDPGEHDRRFLSYNVPEFARGPVQFSRKELRRICTEP